jgi:hypothetical protein
MSRFVVILFVCFGAISVSSNQLDAQSFIFAGENNGVDIVTHPIGYTGAGGQLDVTVGIDPTSVNAADMEISTRNVVRTWNLLQATTNNISFGLPSGDFDFESVLLHEVGHSIGLGHVNLGSQLGVSGANTDFSSSTDGADDVFSFGAGADGVIGSSDDQRGDDVNLNYFNSQNDPFILDPSGVVDRTTYSRDVANLPSGHSYVANSSRQVSSLLGYGLTEGVMNQGTFNNEIQRDLAASDVAGIMYGQSGLDEIQGTADDYDLNLIYADWDGSAGSRPDIVIDFDSSQTGFAVSRSNGVFLNGGDGPHIAITTNSIFLNSGFNWYFNDVLAVPEPSGIIVSLFAGLILARRRKR